MPDADRAKVEAQLEQIRQRITETGEPSTVAIVFLVTGDILKPYSVAHSRHWSISPASAEEFAEGMTRIYGDPIQAMQPIEEVLTGETGSGLVMLDPDEEGTDA